VIKSATRFCRVQDDPTRPASLAHLCTELSRHGITTHAARNTAVSTVAAELPAPILASITSLSINTGPAGHAAPAATGPTTWPGTPIATASRKVAL